MAAASEFWLLASCAFASLHEISRFRPHDR
jgi:hypothetical protein